MPIYEVKAQYTGFEGAPGFNTLYFVSLGGTLIQAEAAAAHDIVADFLTAYSADLNGMANGVTWRVLSDVVGRDTATGAGQSVFTVASVAGTGSAAGEFLPSANCLVSTWRTAQFGAKGRGRSFMPPGTEGQSNAGLPFTTAVTALSTAANNMVTDAAARPGVNFVVWHRPTVNLPSSGEVNTVSSASVSAKWAILRSRRD